jgi:tetratricopeptide (TPR) repeat protein
MEKAQEIAEIALQLDDAEAWAHMVLALTNVHRRNFDLAIRHAERAVALNPNDPGLTAKMGLLLADMGRPTEAIALIERAMRLNPFEAESYAIVSGSPCLQHAGTQKPCTPLKCALIRNSSTMCGWLLATRILAISRRLIITPVCV